MGSALSLLEICSDELPPPGNEASLQKDLRGASGHKGESLWGSSMNVIKMLTPSVVFA